MLENLLLALSPSVVPCVISLTTLGDIGPRLQAAGIAVHAVGMRRGMPNLGALISLVRLLRQFRPQVVHTWLYHANLLGGLAARLAGVRSILWGIHGSNLDPAVNRPSTMLVMRACARLSRWLPQRIACVAARARDAHARAGYDATRMVVIPNGFDLKRFYPDPEARSALRRELGLPAHAPLVGMIGRFDAQKNHRGFCDALAGVLAARPDVYVVLVGQNIDAANTELAGWLSAAGVAQNCKLLGLRSDIPRVTAALDVLALPSIGEAFPNVVGEAMACGVPCAVTDVGDTAAIVGGLGRVVPPGDMAGLAEAILALLSQSPAERDALAQQLRNDVLRRFDISSVARRYEAEYRSMLTSV